MYTELLRHITTKKALKALPSDIQFTTYVLEKVNDCKDVWELYCKDNGSLLVPKTIPFVPKPGMIAQFYGKGLGYTVRGVVIQGQVFYYRTIDEAEKDFQRYLKLEDKRKAALFKKEKKGMDKRFNALPKDFQERIANFRQRNPKFRQEFEGYELFCCEEAVKIANGLGTFEAIDEWKKLKYEDQIKQVSISDGHSGNTFGCSVVLAKLHLMGRILEAHGALAPLVGCKEYGCH